VCVCVCVIVQQQQERVLLTLFKLWREAELDSECCEHTHETHIVTYSKNLNPSKLRLKRPNAELCFHIYYLLKHEPHGI